MNFLRNLTIGGNGGPDDAPTAAQTPPLTVLVIDGGHAAEADWASVFRSATVQGRALEVVQAGWPDILVTAEPCATYGPSKLMVSLKQKLANNQTRNRTIRPDAVVVRNEVYAPNYDYRNQLYGLMYGGVPCCVNSLHSIYCFCEKAVVMAELHRLQRQLGNERFPVIPTCYFSSHKSMMYGGSFPCVVKIGSAHAGMGKMIIEDHHKMEDFRSVLAMTEGKYCTAEEFIAEPLYDLRIQKLGPHVRTFRRVSASGTWKTNTGTSLLEHVEVTPTHRRWAEAAATMFGGLDILTVDAIHDSKTGKEFILEVNGTSSGLSPDFADEDNERIRDLAVAALGEVLSRQEEEGGGGAEGDMEGNEEEEEEEEEGAVLAATSDHTSDGADDKALGT
jgi:glutathione synthase/RimK-type ligase-like ATP-grasp enzyme